MIMNNVITHSFIQNAYESVKCPVENGSALSELNKRGEKKLEL